VGRNTPAIKSPTGSPWRAAWFRRRRRHRCSLLFCPVQSQSSHRRYSADWSGEGERIKTSKGGCGSKGWVGSGKCIFLHTVAKRNPPSSTHVLGMEKEHRRQRNSRWSPPWEFGRGKGKGERNVWAAYHCWAAVGEPAACLTGGIDRPRRELSTPGSNQERVGRRIDVSFPADNFFAIPQVARPSRSAGGITCGARVNVARLRLVLHLHE
jgi:hypothetical protein